MRPLKPAKNTDMVVDRAAANILLGGVRDDVCRETHSANQLSSIARMAIIALQLKRA